MQVRVAATVRPRAEPRQVTTGSPRGGINPLSSARDPLRNETREPSSAARVRTPPSQSNYRIRRRGPHTADPYQWDDFALPRGSAKGGAVARPSYR